MLYEYLEESPNCVYIPIIYLHEQQKHIHLFTDDFLNQLVQQQFENDVITTDTKSAWIHLLNYYSQLHTQPFSFLDKSTAPILPFVVRGPSSLNGPTYRADGSKLYFRGIHDTR